MGSRAALAVFVLFMCSISAFALDVKGVFIEYEDGSTKVLKLADLGLPNTLGPSDTSTVERAVLKYLAGQGYIGARILYVFFLEKSKYFYVKVERGKVSKIEFRWVGRPPDGAGEILRRASGAVKLSPGEVLTIYRLRDTIFNVQKEVLFEAGVGAATGEGTPVKICRKFNIFLQKGPAGIKIIVPLRPREGVETTPDGRLKFEKVGYVGLRVLTEEEVRKGAVFTEKDKEVSREKVWEEFERLMESGDFSAVWVDIEGKKVVFYVEENPRISQLRVEGLRGALLRKALRDFDLCGTVLNRRKLVSRLEKFISENLLELEGGSLRIYPVSTGEVLVVVKFTPQPTPLDPDDLYTVGELKIEGLAKVSTKEAYEAVGFKQGDTVRAKEIADGMERLKSLGLFQSVLVRWKVSEDKVSVTYIVRENPTVKGVEIEGIHRTKEFVVRREIDIRPGEVLNYRKLEALRMRLLRLGYFQRVSFRVRPLPEPGSVDLVIVVDEVKTGLYGGGVAYSTKTGLVVYLEAKDTNFLGLGQRLEGRVEYGPEHHELSVKHTYPWLVKPRDMLSSEVFIEDKLDRASTPERWVQKAGVEEVYHARAVGDLYLKLGAGLKFEGENWNVRDFLATARIGPYLDGRDLWFAPTKGYYASLDLVPGWSRERGFFGTLDLDARKYFWIEPLRTSLAIRGEAFLATSNTPYLERYLFGGEGSIRLLRLLRRFTAAYVFNGEIRVVLTDILRVALFFDAGWGSNWEETGKMFPESLEEVEYNYGAGVRVVTPMGMLRIDAGYVKGSDKISWTFGFGEMF